MSSVSWPAARPAVPARPVSPVRVPPPGTAPFPVERVPDAATRSVVDRVIRLDGRTRVLATRVIGGIWLQVKHETRLTATSVRRLRDRGVTHVVLKRGLRSVRVPLTWLGARDPRGV